MSSVKNMTSISVKWCKRLLGGLDAIMYVKHQANAVININKWYVTAKEKHDGVSTESDGGRGIHPVMTSLLAQFLNADSTACGPCICLRHFPSSLEMLIY